MSYVGQSRQSQRSDTQLQVRWTQRLSMERRMVEIWSCGAQKKTAKIKRWSKKQLRFIGCMMRGITSTNHAHAYKLENIESWKLNIYLHNTGLWKGFNEDEGRRFFSKQWDPLQGAGPILHNKQFLVPKKMCWRSHLMHLCPNLHNLKRQKRWILYLIPCAFRYCACEIKTQLPIISI